MMRLYTLALLFLFFVGIQPVQPAVCLYDICPSGDVTGVTDTAALQAAIDAGPVYIQLAPGDYHFTKTGGLGLLTISRNNITVTGESWNNTTLYMVGVETNPAADWYLFHVQYRDKFTLANVTIDGGQLVTVAEQTHGIVIQESTDITLENVRGRKIYGDTVKLLYTCQNCRFTNTEHIDNGRSGIAMRGTAPAQSLTYGGITIDGLLCVDVSDQCVDMETGITPGEMILSNGRIYGENNNGLCLAIVGEAGGSLRVTLNNFQVFCKTYLFNAEEVVISNSLFDASGHTGPALKIQKASHHVIVSDSILYGDGINGVLQLTAHNSGRPEYVSLSNLLIRSNNAAGQGIGIHFYDVANVSINNVTIENDNQIGAGVLWRTVTAGIDRGYLSIDGLRVNGAAVGVQLVDTAPEPVTMIDTLTVAGSHFRNMTTGIKMANPTYHNTPYVRVWDFGGNVFGENVTNEIVLGSVFQ